MYNTRARVSEIVDALVSDVTLKPAGTFHFRGKGRKERVLPLWKRTVKILSKWIATNHLGPDQPLFPNAGGAAMTRSGVEKRLQEAVRRAGEACPSIKKKRVSPHTLRHTTAMHLLQSGVDITVIAMWLGHESIETTHLYVTTSLELKEKRLRRSSHHPAAASASSRMTSCYDSSNPSETRHRIMQSTRASP